MPKADRMQKLPRQPGIPFGTTTAFPILTADFEAGMRIGVSEAQPGEVHLDLDYDEAVYVLDGELEIVGDGTVHALKTGDLLWMPKGRKIIYRNTAPCRYLYAIPMTAP